MRRAILVFTVGLAVLVGGVVFTIVRGEDTRDRVEVVEKRIVVDPCARPRSEECQRRIALVLKALVKRHPDVLKDLGLKVRRNRNFSSPPAGQGGGAVSPQGNGPTGRVRGPRPVPPTPPTPEPPNPPAPVDVDVPVPVDVCVVELVKINC